MKEIYRNREWNVVVIGDAFIKPEVMEKAIRSSSLNVKSVKQLFWGSTDKKIYTRMQQNVEKNGPEAEAWADGLEDVIEEADLIFHCYAPLCRTILEKGKNLKAIFVCRGGTEQIDMDYCLEKKIAVETVVRNKTAVAEFIVGQMIAMTRNLISGNQKMKQGKWVKSYANDSFRRTISDQLIGIVGMGNISKELVKILQIFGCRILIYSSHLENGLEGKIEFTRSMDRIFQEADIISLQLRECKETKNIIDKHLLEQMKSTAYLINTARAGIMDYDTLYQLLVNRKIAGAALDVFPKEPFLEEKFLKLENVLLTPHIAGDTMDAIANAPLTLMKKLEAE